MKRSLILITSALALGGCSVIPGMYMRDWSGTSSLEVPVANSDPVPAKVDITAITADYIIKQGTSPGAEAQSSLAPPPKEKFRGYRIGPRDVLSITVWDHPELTIPAGEFRSAEAAGHVVTEDGTLFYPYVGVVKVAGMTVEKLRATLTTRLAQYIENPQLDVRIAVFRSQKAYIAGEVKMPGTQPVRDVPLTVAEAINLCGGITEDADMNNVTLSRGGRNYKIDLLALYEKGDVSQDVLLRDGDVLNIPDRNYNKVFLMGEVLKPSALVMTKGRMTLAEALGEVGGVDQVTSDPGRIYVIRHGHQNPNVPNDGNGQYKPEIFHLDASSPDGLLLAHSFSLAPRDVVYVDTAGVTRWNRVISQVLPTSQLLYQAAGANFPLFQGGGG